MSKITTFLKRLIRRILMNAWWTAFGAMLIPVGVIFMIEKPETAGISQWLIIVGLVFAIAGLALTVREERKKERRERAMGRRGKAYLMILTRIASALGVDMPELFKEIKTFVDEYEDDV